MKLRTPESKQELGSDDDNTLAPLFPNFDVGGAYTPSHTYPEGTYDSLYVV